jgi:hypothetical protein
MSDMIASFIRIKHIDSFQKLCFLLFLHQYPELTGTSREFAERLYFGDVRLVDCVENRYKLNDGPDVRSSLQYLTGAFEDPLARQEILDQVRAIVPLSRY